MEETQESPASWTHYPSLIPPLTSYEDRVALEQAAAAAAFGNYRDAHAIYESRLPKSHTIPILTLQRADCYSQQMLEHERIKLLKDALGTLSETEPVLKSIRLLMRLMLAEASYRALGETDGVVELLKDARESIRARGIDNILDVEVGLINTYYFLSETFGLVVPNSMTNERPASCSFNTHKFTEIKMIRKKFQSQSRWQLTLKILLLELKHAPPGAALSQSIEESLDICTALDNSKQTPLLFQLALLKLRLANKLQGLFPAIADGCEIRAVKILSTLTSASQRWEELYPIIGLSYRQQQVRQSERLASKQVERLLALVETAKIQDAYRPAASCLTLATEIAKKWYEESKGPPQLIALEQLRKMHVTQIAFYQCRTKMLILEAVSRQKYNDLLLKIDKDYEAVLKCTKDFEIANPDFNIPDILELMYIYANEAAKRLGLNDQTERYAQKLEDNRRGLKLQMTARQKLTVIFDPVD